MSALSAFTPPLPDYYTKGNVLFAFAEAVAAGRRPRSTTGSGSAGCLHDRHYTTLLYWYAGVRSKMGVSFWLSLESYTGFRNQLLWSPPNLDHTHWYAAGPLKLKGGAVQNGGGPLKRNLSATTGRLHWTPRPIGLDDPKSGLHPSPGVQPSCLDMQWLKFRDAPATRAPAQVDKKHCLDYT